MKYSNPGPAMGALVIGACLVVATTAQAQNQPLQTWTPQPQAQPQEMDPAKRVPATTTATRTADALPVVDTTAAQAAPAAPTAYATSDRPAPYANRGGFFVGVHGGKGEVYEDVEQTARMLSAGYRWQAGAVTLVGIEVARGQLAEKRDTWFRYDEVDYASIGANARFNFGRNNPVYALVRAGYWAAEASIDNQWSADIDGAYVGVGVGADFGRHFNMSLVYTNHVYFENYNYWNDYDVNRADTLMLGAEVRF
ncbi:porin family protein [Luteimonas yindakuii]|uniref:Porin family protein n=1 Tax=Luteimonas yindakuii TaxID=2565782 RepID=A0A4Z1REX2_9GAMM|nr:outer membrane beta-barrel protein [Luteimonas yindakuii]TKS53227.1 porin family protein [Luteimonas yindakuii]